MRKIPLKYHRIRVALCKPLSLRRFASKLSAPPTQRLAALFSSSCFPSDLPKIFAMIKKLNCITGDEKRITNVEV